MVVVVVIRVLVVSEWFIGKDRMERTAMVLHALLNGAAMATTDGALPWPYLGTA